MAEHEIREETLPFAEIPLDLMCPVCGSGPYKTENGLRGHAYGAHKLKWGLKPRPPKRENNWLSTRRDTADLTEIEHLKPWHKLAILQNHVLGMPFTKIAVTLGRSHEHLGEVAKSPAGVKFKEQLDELIADTPSLVRMAIQSSSLGMAIDDATALEWAKDAKDYKFVHTFAQDYFKIAGVITPQDKPAAQAIHLHLTTDQLTVPEIQTSHEIVVKDVDFEVEG